jgi:hypothetical protein
LTLSRVLIVLFEASVDLLRTLVLHCSVLMLQRVTVNWMINKRASAVHMTHKCVDNRGTIPSKFVPQKTKQQRLTMGFIMLFMVQMKISTPSENLSKTKRLEGIKI